MVGGFARVALVYERPVAGVDFAVNNIVKAKCNLLLNSCVSIMLRCATRVWTSAEPKSENDNL